MLTKFLPNPWSGIHVICGRVNSSHSLLNQTMAHREEGWPLGLQPLNVRVGGHGRTADVSFGSTSFSTFISGSPTSFSDSSSDFDTESTGSFFQDRSITLGRLIGITSILDIPTGCSHRRRRQEMTRSKNSHAIAHDKGGGSKTWFFFSLCLKARADGDNTCNNNGKSVLSLRDFLQIERRTKQMYEMQNRPPVTYELDGLLPETQTSSGREFNSLFSDGCIAPPPPRSTGIGSPLSNARHQVCCW